MKTDRGGRVATRVFRSRAVGQEEEERGTEEMEISRATVRRDITDYGGRPPLLTHRKALKQKGKRVWLNG